MHTELVSRDPHRVRADPARVITQLFVPGQEGFEQQESRAGVVLKRILALTDDDVRSSMDDIITRFDGRHRDLMGTFRRHAHELADRLDPDIRLSDARILLLGATFTSEYAIEGAALCNPSIVAHPDQTDTAAGSLRFVMSVRGIGEGHRSSIGFRTGVVDAAGRATIDEPPRFANKGSVSGDVLLDAAVFRGELGRVGNAGEAANYVFSALGDRFTRSDLDARLDNLRAHLSTRGNGERTVSLIRAIAARSYAVEFHSDMSVSERVLWPSVEAEQAGMEDARFVRFVDDDGSVSYYATYTAYSGSHISQQLLKTEDFQSFTSGPLVGKAAANKGLALFPRRIRGRYVAMSRSDRETNTVAFADHPAVWGSASPCQQPVEAWETLQLGNCGPPIETDAGWLVLTHGVGPMRTYNMGAILLDLDDPTRVLGRLRRPLLSPALDEQNGYVPNVVYSCGGLVHADTLVIPYGINDGAIGIATAPLSQLVATIMQQPDRPR
ncbi:MAG: glycoside hydrolase family 130 protein [Mycobacterium sp.]